MKSMACREGEERPPGFDVEEWDDGSMYEGEFMNGLKHGKGKYTWKTGEYYEGLFYKDYCHGEGFYCWPSGHKFTGKFYLNKREGYGHQLFPDGTSFQGLYHLDHRFGPGIMTYPSGCADVGLWVGKHLHKLCDAAEEGFSLENFPEYAAYMDPAAPSQLELGRERLLDDAFVPPGIGRPSADGDLSLHLLSGQGRELDQVFFGELWEGDHCQGERDPASSLTLQARIEAHIHKHRLATENLSWDVGAVLALNRENFGPKGPLEVISERLIQQAARGDVQTVSKIIRTGLVHPDVANAQGNTALIVATVNRHHDVLHLLLDVGADIDKLNGEGMSALAVCHVLYYPFHCLHAAFTKPPANTQVLESQSTDGSPNIGQVDPSTCGTAISSPSHLTDQTSISSLTSESVQESLKEKRKDYLNTLELLVERGADPNMSRIPMPVLFLAILARDRAGIKRLLLLGARTDTPLPPERQGLYPLHVAAALPGPAGPEITEMLLHTVQDPDARAYDHDDIFELDKVFMKAQESASESARLKQGGRTALHTACQRDSDHQNASKIVALLLSHRASTDLLWSGHSPLSLAIATGNILAVEELLNGGANPNIPLGPGVGSALCAFANIHYTLDDNKEKLLELLVKAGVDILMPVMVDGDTGTAMDYAYYSFNQDLHITRTPFNALNTQEQEIFKARCRLLCMMGDLMRQTAHKREQDFAGAENFVLQRSSSQLNTSPQQQQHSCRKVFPKFCYYCGRSVSVRLTPCYRCYKVFYCSKPCRLKAWDALHKKECFRVNAGARGSVSAVGLSESAESQNSLEPSTMIQGGPRENYTFN